MRLRRKVLWASAPVGVALVCFAATVFACSALPQAEINSQYVFPGQQVMLTGKAWMPQVLSVRLDSTSGPLLATLAPNPDGTLGPVAITIPGSTAPGDHLIIVATPGNSHVPTVSRNAIQVLSPTGEYGRPPGAVLPVAATSSSPVPTAAVLGLFALLALGGVGFLTTGAVALARTRGRTSVPTEVRRR